MRTYRVEIDSSARGDIEDLTTWIRNNMSSVGGDRYLDAMKSEINTLSVYADLYQLSHYADIRRFHPKARRMVSHNKKWAYIFHIEEDRVVVDRIISAKLITK
ncbi:MAG: type II toxin-antitoxin system RelE/ParE family toxin [Bacteroidales bacterium]|nr:type II toxin-antitoxin system RelE/ParE family toxin [Bacteroidales bacterium]